MYGRMQVHASFWLQVLFAGGLWASTGQVPGAEVLIKGYGECTERFQTVSYDIESTLRHENGEDVHTLTHYSRGDSKQWIGSLKAYKKDGTYNPGRSAQIITIFNEKRGVVLQMYNGVLKRPRMAVLFSASRARVLQGYIETPAYGGPLTGRLFGSKDQSICRLFKGASRPRVHSQPAKILRHDAYLIEADTQYGCVRAWISPDLGYNCLKWELCKAEKQFYRDGVAVDEGATSNAVYEATKVDRVGGLHVVTEARFEYKVTDADSRKLISHSSCDYKVVHINFNPDYESVGAFKIQLPEDTIVYDQDVPGVTYRWRNGQMEPTIKEPVSLLGKPLPNSEGFDPGLSSADTEGKKILLCFFDVQQRPSRNMLIELAKRGESFSRDGIVVTAVQIVKVDRAEFDKWIGDDHIPFPVHAVQADEEEMRLTWGVQSLPWLILTDRAHVVKGEGVQLAELEQAIEKAGDRRQ